MEYTGVVRKYDINRPLTDEELSNQFKQNKKLKVEPQYNLSVIRMNSSFMEVVDKYYSWKGIGIFVGFVVFSMIITALIQGSLTLQYQYSAGKLTNVPKGDLYFLLCMMVIGFFVAIGLLLHTLYIDCFKYTHYPIRLDRKNQRVYVFRRNGTVLDIAWDDVFFTNGRCKSGFSPQEWELVGHVLASDGKTVIETFPFNAHTTEKEKVALYWEFVRRYMENGPEKIIEQVEVCLPIAEQKEGFKYGVVRLLTNFVGIPLFMWLLSPLLLAVGIARYFAMATCKIPKWPAEVEAACQIEADDPYAIDANNRKWNTP